MYINLIVIYFTKMFIRRRFNYFINIKKLTEIMNQTIITKLNDFNQIEI